MASHYSREIDNSTDTLWIYHTRQGRDAGARLVESTSISAAELARLRNSLNMVLHVVVKDDCRQVTIEWARRGRQDITLDDITSCWRGMPECQHHGLSWLMHQLTDSL